ncbi:MAG: NVEALA domain-containing protein [Dysgonamonadaceae bacterium]|jgi:hypothetical protein|nr:NVEALA domain-containing protein [Dysgonamonadaceae bacterium]
MKTNQIFGLIATVVLIALAIFNLDMSSKEKNLSEVALANIEALSQSEGGGTTANVCCPIWNITIQTYPTYVRSCSTGGLYKCDDCDNCSN